MPKKKRSSTADKICNDSAKGKKVIGMTWRPVKCLVCGQTLDVLTHCHANKHGYERKEYMIEKGLVQLC